ncbi:prepilin-type cleavage/methylation domain-containing protein [Xenophilus aerolatus]|nr:prepilin-type cleavage/methylation domain-containing protein [Xenophilus aerolatus]
MRRARGFTLIEVLITVAIVAILAAIALPSYNQYVIRSKRSAAQAEMMNIANREQQYLLAQRVYADKTALIAGGYVLPTEIAASYDYDVALSSSGPPTFTITFQPKGSQASDGNLTLDSQGVKTPEGKW